MLELSEILTRASSSLAGLVTRARTGVTIASPGSRRWSRLPSSCLIVKEAHA